MSFNLNDVFEEAKADPLSVSINALEFEAQLLCGIKIIRDRRKLLKTSRVTILNTQRGGDHYSEIQPNDYEMFKTFGWKHGVYVLSLSNCCLKIDRLEQSIVNEELREQPREKQIKSTRIQIQKSHNRKLLLIEKFNKFKNNQL
tara:strand:- start:17870 stop:18301 length:432 start_codon:yes stop_codon:yes gene_type:complete